MPRVYAMCGVVTREQGNDEGGRIKDETEKRREVDKSKPRHRSRAVRRARAIPPAEVAPRALLDGADLIAMGLTPGPEFKRILDRVYRAQLDGEISSKAQAIDMVQTRADPQAARCGE
jgi:hypothetical protein